MPGPVFRRGETIELRTPEDEDVDFLQELVNDPRVRHRVQSAEPVTRAGEREWLEVASESDGVHFVVAVDGDPVGSIGLDSLNAVWGTAEVGYMIAPEHWDNGYATDALREVCGYGFDERRLHKIFAKTYASNPASARVVEKVGFSEEGVLRKEAFVEGEYVDVLRYGLLAEEWRQG